MAFGSRPPAHHGSIRGFRRLIQIGGARLCRAKGADKQHGSAEHHLYHRVSFCEELVYRSAPE